MALHTLTVTPDRIGASLGRILAHAMPTMVLSAVGVVDNRKKNTGKVTIYRRYLPKGATPQNPNMFFQNGAGDRTAAFVAQHQTQDGVTPIAETLIPQDISVEQKEFAFIYGFTNQTVDMGEDPIPTIAEEMVGERIGLIREMNMFGVLKSCTNKFYGGNGTSRATVNGRLTLQLLNKIERNLKANHAKRVTKMVQMVPSSGNYATMGIDPSFVVFASSDLEQDIRDLPGFIKRENYGSMTKALPNEIGSLNSFKFFISPELVAIQDAGAAVAGTVPQLLSTTGTNADVYQVIVGSEDAWGTLGLALTKDDITLIPVGQKDKTDPLGQRGYVGAKWYHNAVRLNEGQMAVVEVGASALVE